MKKQLLLLSTILFSSNTFTIIPENAGTVAKHLGKGFLWSMAGYSIISTPASMRFMERLMGIQEKIQTDGKVTLESQEELIALIQKFDQKNSSFLQSILPLILTIPAGYCFVQMWNHYSSIVNTIKG